jgi:hypothetical protein
MRYLRSFLLLFVFPSAVLSSANCRRDVSAAEIAEQPSVSAAANVAPSGPRIDEPAFTLSLTTNAPCSVDKSGVALLELKAKRPHHVNQEYPHKFRLKPTDGITFPNSTLARDAMTLEPMAISLKVPFTPTRSGTLTISGEFAFSLCTADRCLIEKRTLSTEIRVQK